MLSKQPDTQEPRSATRKGKRGHLHGSERVSAADRGWGRGDHAVAACGYTVSLRNDENVLESDSMDGYTTSRCT